MRPNDNRLFHTRRGFLATAAAAGGCLAARPLPAAEKPSEKAQICLTLDLEMSRHYPQRGIFEWDFQKGNLDDATKRYAVKAGELVRDRGGIIHYFCVARVLEQPDVAWLKQLAKTGHPIGNHTYDHVNVKATTVPSVQFRFKRAPWLAGGRKPPQLIRDNIQLADAALSMRAGIQSRGFRTPGGFHSGLDERPDLQKMLQELGFTWISSKYPRHLAGKPFEKPTPDILASVVAAQAQAQPYVYPGGLVEIPMSPVSDVHAFRSTRWKLDWFLEAIRGAVEWAIEHRAVFDFLAHPSCLGIEDPALETMQMICELVKQNADRAEIVSLDAVAKRVLAQK
ncbi:MAG: chitin deacetylase [Planctomycetaceae bacterium]|nr:chitin deacetylase [Planctomycetaceae bacterium]